ncbi:hypothetical protein RUM43_003848 [Polyplax serrata]|uniref:Uncharacterized protein n=1 Tax=Polyplax serrata TaxID=468196 RepID=A0AAN8S905_POLSC
MRISKVSNHEPHIIFNSNNSRSQQRTKKGKNSVYAADDIGINRKSFDNNDRKKNRNPAREEKELKLAVAYRKDGWDIAK